MNYIDNTIMLDEIKECKKQKQVSDKLGLMFLKIVDGLINHKNFRGYSEDVKNDMKSYAIERMMYGFQNFKTSYKKPFPYFTRISWYAFIFQIKKHYKSIKNFKKYQIDFYRKNNFTDDQIRKIIGQYDYNDNNYIHTDNKMNKHRKGFRSKSKKEKVGD